MLEIDEELRSLDSTRSLDQIPKEVSEHVSKALSRGGREIFTHKWSSRCRMSSVKWPCILRNVVRKVESWKNMERFAVESSCKVFQTSRTTRNLRVEAVVI